MEPATTTTLFPLLVEGLESFRDRVSGSEGNHRRALLVSGQPAVVLSISRSVLGVVRELLVWLRDAIVLVRERLLAIDAVLAIAEVANVLMRDLGTAFTIALPSLGSAATDVTSSVSALATTIDALPDPALLPAPELLAELLATLEELVGPAEGGGEPGTLDRLLQDIQTLAA
jgi:hypothetical protein